MSDDLMRLLKSKIDVWSDQSIYGQAAARIRELEAERDEAVTQMVEAKVERDNAAARIRELRELLDECEQALEFIAQDDCGCDECNKAREMLARLRSQEQTDE